MRYFKNVRSYKELKETYRDLLKKNHPDNGGNLETMQEINQEYDIAFRIWKNKDQTITEEEKKETAQGTRRNFYTAFGWEGSRYDSNLTLKEIAVIVRKYIKEQYPTYKFSVRTAYASMCQELHVDLKESPIEIYKYFEDLTEEDLHNIGKRLFTFDNDAFMNFLNSSSEEKEEIINASSSRWSRILNEATKAVVDDVDAFVKSYNYSDCDGQIDYFDVNFYYFGCCQDNGYNVQIVPKTARIKSAAATPATTPEQPEQISTSGEAYTIQESQHTKTGEKIYLVKWLDNLSRDNYIKLNNEIKKLGGYYSKFTHSFIFKEDPSEALKEVRIA